MKIKSGCYSASWAQRGHPSIPTSGAALDTTKTPIPRNSSLTKAAMAASMLAAATNGPTIDIRGLVMASEKGPKVVCLKTPSEDYLPSLAGLWRAHLHELGCTEEQMAQALLDAALFERMSDYVRDRGAVHVQNAAEDLALARSRRRERN